MVLRTRFIKVNDRLGKQTLEVACYQQDSKSNGINTVCTYTTYMVNNCLEKVVGVIL